MDDGTVWELVGHVECHRAVPQWDIMERPFEGAMDRSFTLQWIAAASVRSNMFYSMV